VKGEEKQGTGTGTISKGSPQYNKAEGVPYETMS
jgi:hypothetical protein